MTNFLRLMPKTRILDVGTGGGLPGIPLAICYPQARFTLLDSIGKKVMVVEDMVKQLGLTNVEITRAGVKNFPKKEVTTLSLGVRLPHCPPFLDGSIIKSAKGHEIHLPTVFYI